MAKKVEIIDKISDSDKVEELFMGKKPLKEEDLEKMFEKEKDSGITTILNNLRLDIEGEYLAIRGYESRADVAEKNGYSDIAKVLRDISEEEKNHVGELQVLLGKYDKNYDKAVKKGKREANKALTI